MSSGYFFRYGHQVGLTFTPDDADRIFDLLVASDRLMVQRAKALLATPMFTKEARTMNEREYEKSIAEPMRPFAAGMLVTADLSGVLGAIKAEREFSRGVWEEHKLLRRVISKLDDICHDAATLPDMVPIPDAPKTVECRVRVEVIVDGRERANKVLLESEANEIIREVRARTVK